MQTERQGETYGGIGLPERVAILETQQRNMCQDIGEIKLSMRELASKEDVKSLRAYFDCRDQNTMKYLWWVLRTIIVAIGFVLVAALSLDWFPISLL